METTISGGISGAITDPDSPKAIKHAYKYYESVRHRTDDIAKIAEYTGYTKEQILKVKNFLFIDTHILSDGIRRFDPCFQIAESWQRLSDMQDYVQEHDKLLIPHELMEMDLINKGLSQEKAHSETSKKYDYPKESDKFYEKLQIERRAKIKKTAQIGGAITRSVENDWSLRL